MATATPMGGEEAMTDFQLKALMSMVLDIVDKSSDKEEIKRAIKKLVTGKLDEGFTDEE
jgi:hypothetical protein